MDIQEPEFTSEQVRSVLFTQDAGNQCQSRFLSDACDVRVGWSAVIGRFLLAKESSSVHQLQFAPTNFAAINRLIDWGYFTGA